MILYLAITGVFSICALERILSEKERKRVFAAGLFLLWLLATLRVETIGNDTKNYLELFDELNRFGLSYRGRYEFAYVCLSLLVGFFTDNFTIFLAVADTVIYLAIYLLFERYGENRMLTLIMFLMLGFWGQTVNIIRMELAMAMVIFALLCRQDQKYGWMIVFIVLAPLFQKTSIVYLAGLVLPRSINKRLCSIILIGAAPVSVFLPKLMALAAELMPYFAVYLGDDATYAMGGVTVACLLDAALLVVELSFAIVVYNRNQDCLSEKQREFYALSVNMGIIAVAVMLIASRFSVLDRCSIFYSLFLLILMPNAVTWMKKREDRILTTILVIAACISYFTVINIYRPDWNTLIPYHSVLWR